MKKNSVLLLILCFVSFQVRGLGPWIIHITNGTPMKLSVVKKYIYPDIGGTFKEQVISVRSVGKGEKLALNQAQYISTNHDERYQLAIGTVIEIQGGCGLGASPYSRTNKVVIARPFLFMQLQSVPRFTRQQLSELVKQRGLDESKLTSEDLFSMQKEIFARSLGRYKDDLMIPMVPSGAYRVLWNKNASCKRSLTVTQRNQVNPALNLYYP